MRRLIIANNISVSIKKFSNNMGPHQWSWRTTYREINVSTKTFIDWSSGQQCSVCSIWPGERAPSALTVPSLSTCQQSAAHVDHTGGRGVPVPVQCIVTRSANSSGETLQVVPSSPAAVTMYALWSTAILRNVKKRRPTPYSQSRSVHEIHSPRTTRSLSAGSS